MKISSLISCVSIVTSIFSAQAQWTAGSHGHDIIASSPYSSFDGGDGWSRTWSFDTTGSFTCSESSTGVKVQANNFWARGASEADSRTSGTYSKSVSESPYGTAYSDWLWMGTPGGAGSVGVTHAVTNTGHVYAQGYVRSAMNTTAFAWPTVSVQFSSQTYHIISGNPAGVVTSSYYANADGYAYQSNHGTPDLFPDVSGDATFSSVAEDASPDDLYSSSTADADYTMIFTATYSTAPALASIHASALVAVNVSAYAEVTVSVNGQYSLASTSCEGSASGTTEVRLVF